MAGELQEVRCFPCTGQPCLYSCIAWLPSTTKSDPGTLPSVPLTLTQYNNLPSLAEKAQFLYQALKENNVQLFPCSLVHPSWSLCGLEWGVGGYIPFLPKPQQPTATPYSQQPQLSEQVGQVRQDLGMKTLGLFLERGRLTLHQALPPETQQFPQTHHFPTENWSVPLPSFNRK